jgi:hypothetical protein
MKTGTTVSLLTRITVSELDVSVSPIQTLFDHELVFGYIVKGLLGD